MARANGYAELVGDYILQCFGGMPRPVMMTVFVGVPIDPPGTQATRTLTMAMVSAKGTFAKVTFDPNFDPNALRWLGRQATRLTPTQRHLRAGAVLLG